MQINETLQSIFNRRSCRNFKQVPIEKEKLDLIIQSGLAAPSGLNSQNWHFTVLHNAAKIRALSDKALQVLGEDAVKRIAKRGASSIFYDAPTVMIISGEEGDKWTATNIALATQNICLAAESLNIKSCIIGMVTALFLSQADSYAKEFSLPSGYKPYYAISLGYGETNNASIARKENKVNTIL